MMRDGKFAERMVDHLLWRTSAGKHRTLAEYGEAVKGKLDDGVVLYCADPNAQAAYLKLLDEHGLEAAIADSLIDQHFIPFLEMHTQRKWKFQRVDADVSKHLIDSGSSLIVDSKDQKTTGEKVEKLFRDHLTRERVKVRVERFKSEKVPAVLVFDEQQRRLKEMAKHPAFAAMAAGLPDDHTLVVNQASPAIQNLLSLSMSFNRDEEVKLIVNQIYDLAWLQQGELTAEMMQAFIARSTAILGRLGGSAAGAAGGLVTPVEDGTGRQGASTTTGG
jgi:molecular chaperone HtpG